MSGRRDITRSANAELDGSISIRLLDFGIGAAEWADLRLIGNQVQVHFKLPLTSPDVSRAAGRQPRG